MRRFILWALLAVFAVGGASLAFSFPYGAVAMRTGSFAVKNKAAEPNCSLAGCHTPDINGIPPGINDPSGKVSILDVPKNYVPGMIYPLRVKIEHTWDPVPPDPQRWGFQLQAVAANTGDSAGIWVLGSNTPPDSFKITKVTAPTSIYRFRRYLDQAGPMALEDDHPGSPTHLGETGAVEWHMNWLAPFDTIGTIYFFAAGNSANGDNACFQSGDFIFTTAESSKAATTVDVPGQLFPSTTLRAFPNPMNRVTTIDFTTAKGGLVDLAVFDLQGRQVRSLVREYRSPGTWNWSWDGRDNNGAFAMNGLYFVRLLAPGEAQPFTRKISLAR